MRSSANFGTDSLLPKAAFIGHSYHKTTKSSQFFIDLLSSRYDVDFFWDETWKEQGSIDFNNAREKQYNLVILYQIMYPVSKLRQLKYHGLVLVPMYDEVHGINRNNFFWKQYKGASFLCFSKMLHEKFTKLSLKSEYFQFFPPPVKIHTQKTSKTRKAFFWHRTNELQWETIKQILPPGTFEQLHIHSTPDPPFNKQIKIPHEDITDYNITISTWYKKREDFLKVLIECDVFFAPRPYEGIGMSFLEAMAMGKCVVGPDHPTMNEYIVHGVTGILYDPAEPKQYHFNDCDEIGKNARQSIISGYNSWTHSHEDLYLFLEKAGKVTLVSGLRLFYELMENLLNKLHL